ncbi:MAG: T9SS type A sorting domain-containing protein [Rhodothermales bacterium]
MSRLSLRAIAPLLSLALAGLQPTGLFAQDADPASVSPGTLLVYYGWPSVINGAGSVDLAAEALGQYDYVVLGDGLEIDTHPDYANTVALLAHPAMADTKVFGYIDLGVTTQNLPVSEYKLRMVWWTDIGADGIFLDDFGYDFGVTRERQNDAVDFAHALEVPVMVNAWDPDDAFSRAADPTYNPNERRAALQAGDFYFSESYMIQEGAYVDAAFWREKADKLDAYRQTFGVGVMSVTTPGGTYDEQQFHYAWHAAAIDGHTAIGWGEPSFSSVDAQAPFRVRPAVDLGSAYVSVATVSLPLVRRETDAGVIEVNTETHAYRFEASMGTALETPERASAAPRLAPNYPNPFASDTRLAFSLAEPGPVRLAVYDLMGRPVAVLADGTMPAGEHAVNFNGAALPAGVYFCRLEAGGRVESRPIIVGR